MKVAIIGSSHAACLKSGWDLIEKEMRSLVNPLFFAVGGKYLSSFGKDENDVFRVRYGTPDSRRRAREQARVINGVEEIYLGDCDAICLVGFFTGIEVVHRLLPQVSCRDAPAEQIKNKTVISSQTLNGIMSDLLREAIARWPLGRGGASRRLFGMPSPFPFEKMLDLDVGGVLGAKTLEALECDDTYTETVCCYIQELERAFNSHLNVELLSQPAETISSYSILSLNEYCKGALTLGGEEQPNKDFTHANPQYGALFWRDFASKISC